MLTHEQEILRAAYLYHYRYCSGKSFSYTLALMKGFSHKVQDEWMFLSEIVTTYYNMTGFDTSALRDFLVSAKHVSMCEALRERLAAGTTTLDTAYAHSTLGTYLTAIASWKTAFEAGVL